MLEEYPDILTVAEMREILFIGRNKAYQLLNDKIIKGTRIGRTWRISKSDIVKYLDH